MNQRIKIIDVVKAGYIIKILDTKYTQVIPKTLLFNRIKWGIYTLMNPEMIRP